MVDIWYNAHMKKIPSIALTGALALLATSCGTIHRAEQAKDAAPNTDLLAPYYEMAKKPRTGKFDKYVHPYTYEEHDDPRFVSPRGGFRGQEAMERGLAWRGGNGPFNLA